MTTPPLRNRLAVPVDGPEPRPYLTGQLNFVQRHPWRLPASTNFAALGDTTRRAIVAWLASGKATVSELAAPFTISLPAISRHLKVLERAELIVRIPDGQHRWCQLNPSAIREDRDWLASHP